MRERDLTKNALQKRINNVEKLTNEYELTIKYMQDVSSLWLEEIDKLVYKLVSK